MKSLGRIFRVGDRIIQTRNNEDVSNGEVGIISRIYTDDDGERLVDITLLDGREVTYNDELMENVDLSYCITVHKSQGGEFSTVIIPITEGTLCHAPEESALYGNLQSEEESHPHRSEASRLHGHS